MKNILATSEYDASRVSHVMHVNDKGLRILVDDNVVRQLPEGQDMMVDINEASSASGSAPGSTGSAIDITLTY